MRQFQGANGGEPLVSFAGKGQGLTPGTVAYSQAANRWQFTELVLSNGASALRQMTEKQQRTVANFEPVRVSKDVVQVSGSQLATALKERGAIGIVGMAIYNALLLADAPPNMRQLQLLANCTYRQVRYSLDKLNALNLIEKRGRGYVAYSAEPHQIAAAIVADAARNNRPNPLERTKRRAARVESDRQLYAERLLKRALDLHDAQADKQADKASTPRKRVLVAVDTTTGEITPVNASIAQLIASAGLPLDLKITKNGKTQ